MDEEKKELTVGDVFGWWNARRKEKRKKDPLSGLYGDDECEHLWSKWVEEGSKWVVTRPTAGVNKKSTVGEFHIQKRECHHCGLKEQRKYGWGDY